MNVTAEFLESLPSMPTNDFDKINQVGFFRARGAYFNCPVINEVDGVLVNLKVGDIGVQQLFLTEGKYNYERNGRGNWVRTSRHLVDQFGGKPPSA